jgi:2-polyprenyl-6-methoxyphenol hydroxylase-like FAD-dependent oxidoreductase
VMEKGLIATGVQFFIDGKQAAELNLDDLGYTGTPYSFLLMVPQSDIEAILLDDLKRHGIEVERGIEVTGFEQSPDGVVLHGSDKMGEPFDIHAAYLIGADGAHSTVRHILSLNFKGAAYPQNFLLADCKIDWPFDYDHLKIFLHGRNIAVYMPLRGKDICRIIAIEPAEGDVNAPIEQQGSAPLAFGEVQRAFSMASALNIQLYDPVWTSLYRVHHRAVNSYRKGRAFVAGDAAHIHSPAGAQGMNTGLQDAANLAWKLALCLKGHARDTLLDTYQSERWPVGQTVLKTTDRLFSSMTAQSERATQIRNFFVPILFSLLTKSRWVRAKAFHFISQLGIRYDANDYLLNSAPRPLPLGFASSPVAAGRRAPDAAIARDVSVFDLIRNYRFHVLALSRKSLDRDEIETLCTQLASLPKSIGLEVETHLVTHSLIGRDPRLHRAESSDVFEAYGVSHARPQALFLIRPDGYIAFRAESLNIEALKDFLATRFA